MSINHLVVAKDRTHARSLLKAMPNKQVISASAFFDKVRSLLFLSNSLCLRDDNAPILFAQQVLKKTSASPMHFASNYANIYSSCFHGTKRPIEVRDALDRGDDNFKVMDIVAQIDKAMEQNSLVNGVSALFYSNEILNKQKMLPNFFFGINKISLWYLVDLTLLEIEVIKSLSKLGLQFELHFPLDFHQRGINVAVDFIAKQFEADSCLSNIELIFDSLSYDGALTPLVENLFSDSKATFVSDSIFLEQADNLLLEANTVAKKIAQIKTKHSSETVALAIRTIDDRTKIYKNALERLGISVRDRKGIPLLKTDAGVLINTIFDACLFGLRKKDLIGLINHPLLLPALTEKELSNFVKWLNIIGYDNRVLFNGGVEQRYQENLFILKEIYKDQECYEELLLFEKNMLGVIDTISVFKKDLSFSEYLSVVRDLIDKNFAPSLAKENIKAHILELLQSRALTSDSTVQLKDFVDSFKENLSKLTVARADVNDDEAVMLLSLPEILGSSFDHIFIVDMSFGRLPKNYTQDPVLDDQARLSINRSVKKSLFRIYFDDPFEPMPVPPRQALEPFWFATSVASAKKSVHFSCALRDQNGQEQAKSEFFLWLEDYLPKNNYDPPINFVSKDYGDFLSGFMKDKKNIFDDHEGAYKDRMDVFLIHKANDYSFKFNKDNLKEHLSGRIDENPSYPLTPTMIEEFALCPFKGVANKLLSLNNNNSDIDDTNAKIIGQIAHDTLEAYYKNKNRKNKLSDILNHCVNKFCKKNFIANKAVFLCHIEWLKEALVRLINNINELKIENLYQEISIGFDKKGKEAVLLNANGNKYLLGGRIDRIDKTHDGILIIDYKLGTKDNLKFKLSLKEMLKSHFQLAVYMRLTKEKLAFNKEQLSFAFASIRDAELLPAVLEQDHPDMMKRIYNDEEQDSLAHAIDDIFAPLKKGVALAKVGDHCRGCNLSYFCRRTE